MTPQAALKEQIDRYRKLTGEQRLKIALELCDFAREVTREGIRHQHPHATNDEVEELLRQRLRLARS